MVVSTYIDRFKRSVIEVFTVYFRNTLICIHLYICIRCVAAYKFNIFHIHAHTCIYHYKHCVLALNFRHCFDIPLLLGLFHLRFTTWNKKQTNIYTQIPKRVYTHEHIHIYTYTHIACTGIELLNLNVFRRRHILYAYK